MSKTLKFFKKGGKHTSSLDAGAARPLTAAGTIRPSDFNKLSPAKPGKNSTPSSIVDAAISVLTKVI